MKHKVDAAVLDAAPLTKKFAMFHSGRVPMARDRRNMHWLDAADPQSLRMDVLIGQSVLVSHILKDAGKTAGLNW